MEMTPQRSPPSAKRTPPSVSAIGHGATSTCSLPPVETVSFSLFSPPSRHVVDANTSAASLNNSFASIVSLSAAQCPESPLIAIADQLAKLNDGVTVHLLPLSTIACIPTITCGALAVPLPVPPSLQPTRGTKRPRETFADAPSYALMPSHVVSVLRSLGPAAPAAAPTPAPTGGLVGGAQSAGPAATRASAAVWSVKDHLAMATSAAAALTAARDPVAPAPRATAAAKTFGGPPADVAVLVEFQRRYAPSAAAAVGALVCATDPAATSGWEPLAIVLTIGATTPPSAADTAPAAQAAVTVSLVTTEAQRAVPPPAALVGGVRAVVAAATDALIARGSAVLHPALLALDGARAALRVGAWVGGAVATDAPIVASGGRAPRGTSATNALLVGDGAFARLVADAVCQLRVPRTALERLAASVVTSSASTASPQTPCGAAVVTVSVAFAAIGNPRETVRVELVWDGTSPLLALADVAFGLNGHAGKSSSKGEVGTLYHVLRSARASNAAVTARHAMKTLVVDGVAAAISRSTSGVPMCSAWILQFVVASLCCAAVMDTV